MTSTTLRWLLLGLLFLRAGVAHAEGGCPPGMIPASGTDINSCVPIPPGYYSNQQQAQPQPPPPPRWADQWGAIATDSANGILGTATNLPSRSSAENAALADCQSKHGSTCKIQLSYGNQCAAMLVGAKVYNTNAGDTADEAIKKGIKMCTDAGDTLCRVYYSACSLPQRIQ